jgi:hypothetical protein
MRSPELGHMIGSGHGSSPRCAIHRKKDPKVAHKRQRMAVKRGRERRRDFIKCHRGQVPE